MRLRRSGWLTAEIDLPSFAAAAAYCDTQIATTDLYGNAISIPRFQCQSGHRWTVERGGSGEEFATARA